MAHRLARLVYRMLKYGQEYEATFLPRPIDCLPQLLSRLKRLTPAFGSIRAADFSSDHVKRYRSKRLEDGATRAAINREMEIVKRAWNLAQQCDPPKVTRPFYFPMYEENNVRIGFLEDESYRAILTDEPDRL